MGDMSKIAYNLNCWAYHSVAVVVCDIRLVFCNAHLALLYAKRSRRLQKIDRLEAKLDPSH